MNPSPPEPIKYGPRDPFEPCVACGWTLDQDSCARYKSSIKLFYAASNRGAWALGKSFILKERSTSPPSLEAENLRFLKEHSKISIPTMVQDWTENDRYFTITTRLEGETLEEAWPKLTSDDKERIATQVADQLRELRGLTSERMEAPGGKPLWEGGLFPQKPMSSDDEFFNKAVKSIPNVDQSLLQQLRDHMPVCTPYTFTHTDLTACNIIVKNGHFSGFIDFERSGFFPVWFEFVNLRTGLGKDDREWKELLSQKVTQYPAAKNFYMVRNSLYRDPTGELGKEAMKRLVEKSDECPMQQIW
ncbi:kinase-like protein [Xylaria grammica]|nr:kinase-like protein [Xylaria grammica]